MTETRSVDDVRKVLARFQAFYDKRDLDGIEECMALFVDSDELEVIGTGASKPGDNEWCQGPSMVRDLLLSDWEFWGDVALDVEQAHVHVYGDAAWLATTGTVTYSEPEEETYEVVMQYMRRVLDGESPSRLKLYDIAWTGVEVLRDVYLGETYVWPLRFTAVLVRAASEWRFHRMQFSFATTRVPDVRLRE